MRKQVVPAKERERERERESTKRNTKRMHDNIKGRREPEIW